MTVYQMTVAGFHDPALVAFSVAVAILASFTALNLASRLLVAEQAMRFWWLAAAAWALGGGIWSMHFIGMLAFTMPMRVSYDLSLTLLSLFLSVIVVGVGLYIVRRDGTGPRALIGSGVFAGLGIVAMHYTGMAGMQMPRVVVTYDPALFAGSIVIALTAATAAFWLAFRTRRTRERVLASLVMGFAIAGMHYTGMAAAEFTMSSGLAFVDVRPEIQPVVLAVAVGGIASLLLLLGLAMAFHDQKIATLLEKEDLALRRSEERLRALHRNASDVVAILDRKGVFTYEASSAKHILGFDTGELIGNELSAYVHPAEVAAAQRFLDDLQESESIATVELRILHANGCFSDFELLGKNVMQDPAVCGLIVNMRDISERKRLTAELERISETDALTNTLNRRGFAKIAEREFDRARRAKRSISLVMLDIDHFKEVNDVFGHAAGDLVLAMVANRCRKQIRKIDALGRFGGEEFVILLPGATFEVAHEVVARIQRKIGTARIPTIKGEVSVTASFGIATIDISQPIWRRQFD